MRMEVGEKYNKLMAKANLELTGNEFKVFYAWMTDKEDFTVSMPTLATRTGLEVRNVRRNMNSIVKKGFVYVSGTKRVLTTNGYQMMRLYSVNGAQNQPVTGLKTCPPTGLKNGTLNKIGELPTLPLRKKERVRVEKKYPSFEEMEKEEEALVRTDMSIEDFNDNFGHLDSIEQLMLKKRSVRIV